jgi:hypothetical protein
MFPNFVSDNMLRYESTRLMDKYPDYRDVVNEVYDGLLIYEVNALKVWNAAIKDTVGAERLYEQMKEDFATGDTAQPYKPFEQVRAIVISHYQDLLEKQWISELRQKYPVKVNEEVFKSILKKYFDANPGAEPGSILPPEGEKETALYLTLSRFADAVDDACEQNAPNRLCRYIYDLSNCLNQFYAERSILREEDPARQGSYVRVLQLVLRVLELAVSLLGFEAPERM